MESHILKLIQGQSTGRDAIAEQATKQKIRKDMQYKNNVMTNKKEYPLNKVKAKPRNDQKLLTIRNKLIILDDFQDNLDQIVGLLRHGGTNKQALSEQDLVKVIHRVLSTDPISIDIPLYQEFKTTVKSKMSSFSENQLKQLFFLNLVFTHNHTTELILQNLSLDYKSHNTLVQLLEAVYFSLLLRNTTEILAWAETIVEAYFLQTSLFPNHNQSEEQQDYELQLLTKIQGLICREQTSLEEAAKLSGMLDSITEQSSVIKAKIQAQKAVASGVDENGLVVNEQVYF